MNSNHDAYEAGLQGWPVAGDSDGLSARDEVEVLVSRFSDEVRQGMAPSVEAYIAAHPQHAEPLRELLPLIENLERWKLDKELECLRRNLPAEFPVRRLGNYQIVRELGRGGMGIVFEAVQNPAGRRVAIKLLPWRMATDQRSWQDRFRREATTIAGLRHPHIVPVYSFGQSEGYCYYVMQFVEGVSLHRVIQAMHHAADPAGIPAGCLFRTDGWRRFAEFGAQVAQGLEYAHLHGVLHNDIKPANLLVDTDGRAIVTDFGIGRRAEDESTGRDSPPGTLRYCAPERILGQCDIRSDVYSLGATLYELVTGTPVFAARETGPLLEQILNAVPVRPRRINAAIPRALEAVLLRAISRDPAARYPSARALAIDLSCLAGGRRVRFAKFGRVARLLDWCDRRKSRSNRR